MSVEVLLYVIAGLSALLMLGLAAWAMIGDRAKGRRRCPRCFYSMDGASGMLCPECGRTARSEAHLLKTRRHWWRAIAIVAVFGSASVLSGGLARVKQTGGWQDLPNWLVVRLLWLDDARLDQDVERRVKRGLLMPWDVQAVVNAGVAEIGREDATAIGRGLSMLEWVSRNSYFFPDDPGMIARPMLEELKAKKTVDALLDLEVRDPSFEARVLGVMQHLKDADPRALVRVVAALATDSGDIGMARVSTSWRPSDSGRTRRLPTAPIDVMYTWRSSGRAPIAGGGVRPALFGKAVGEKQSDLEALRIWAKSRWEEGLADAMVPDHHLLPELWLWCRLDGFGEESYRAVMMGIRSDDLAVIVHCAELLTGFEWRPEFGTELQRLLESDNVVLRDVATTTIARIGKDAASLLPVLVRQAATLEGIGGGFEFAQAFVDMGGDAAALSEAVVYRLELIYEQRREFIYYDQRHVIGGEPVFHVGLELWWLEHLGVPSKRAEAVCEKYMHIGEYMPSMMGAKTLAAISGDYTRVTNFVLNRKPDLKAGLMLESPQETVLHLIRNRRADTELVIEYFAHRHAEQRHALVTVMHQFLHDWAAIEPFLSFLAGLAADDAAPEQAEAQALIDRHTDYKARSLEAASKK